MKLKLFAGTAVLVVGLVSASGASAALVYFDAQIVDHAVATKSGTLRSPRTR